MIKREAKESIERICRVFIDSLAGNNGLDDSITLKNFLDDAFIDVTERMYAYRICLNIIRERIGENGEVKDNND